MSVYGNVVGSIAPTPDATLSVSGKPADAKSTGDELNKKFDKAGGTFTGTVIAGSDYQDPSTMAVRNSKLSASSEDPTVNGEIVWVYA